jgi:disulfide bond formation protein DsbB
MSILTTIKSMRTKAPHPALFLILGASILALVVALFTEYVLGFPPCKLCIYERIPFVILIKISISGIIATKYERFWLLCAALTLLVSVFIAGYHSGVEHHLFEAGARCNPEIQMSDKLSVDEIKNMLYAKPVATCTKPPFKVLMLSMAEWNLLFNLALLGFVILCCIEKTSFLIKQYAKTIFSK